jgi:1,2-dihydroxy-3-keto-5-methylthiopentene dioxygenase
MNAYYLTIDEPIIQDQPFAQDQPITQNKPPTQNKPISQDQLRAQGIFYEYILPSPVSYQLALNQWKTHRSYTAQDEIKITPQTPNLEGILDMFYKEHLHTDDEARYILKGTGIFDIRSQDDKWMRVKVEPGDLIIIPANRYHRFKLTDEKTITAIRLFKDNPSWTPIYRPQLINQQ